MNSFTFMRINVYNFLRDYKIDFNGNHVTSILVWKYTNIWYQSFPPVWSWGSFWVSHAAGQGSIPAWGMFPGWDIFGFFLIYKTNVWNFRPWQYSNIISPSFNHLYHPRRVCMIVWMNVSEEALKQRRSLAHDVLVWTRVNPLRIYHGTVRPRRHVSRKCT